MREFHVVVPCLPASNRGGPFLNFSPFRSSFSPLPFLFHHFLAIRQKHLLPTRGGERGSRSKGLFTNAKEGERGGIGEKEREGESACSPLLSDEPPRKASGQDPFVRSSFPPLIVRAVPSPLPSPNFPPDRLAPPRLLQERAEENCQSFEFLAG